MITVNGSTLEIGTRNGEEFTGSSITNSGTITVTNSTFRAGDITNATGINNKLKFTKEASDSVFEASVGKLTNLGGDSTNFGIKVDSGVNLTATGLENDGGRLVDISGGNVTITGDSILNRGEIRVSEGGSLSAASMDMSSGGTTKGLLTVTGEGTQASFSGLLGLNSGHPTRKIIVTEGATLSAGNIVITNLSGDGGRIIVDAKSRVNVTGNAGTISGGTINVLTNGIDFDTTGPNTYFLVDGTLENNVKISVGEGGAIIDRSAVDNGRVAIGSDYYITTQGGKGIWLTNENQETLYVDSSCTSDGYKHFSSLTEIMYQGTSVGQTTRYPETTTIVFHNGDTYYSDTYNEGKRYYYLLYYSDNGTTTDPVTLKGDVANSTVTIHSERLYLMTAVSGDYADNVASTDAKTFVIDDGLSLTVKTMLKVGDVVDSGDSRTGGVANLVVKDGSVNNYVTVAPYSKVTVLKDGALAYTPTSAPLTNCSYVRPNGVLTVHGTAETVEAAASTTTTSADSGSKVQYKMDRTAFADGGTLNIYSAHAQMNHIRLYDVSNRTITATGAVVNFDHAYVESFGTQFGANFFEWDSDSVQETITVNMTASTWSLGSLALNPNANTTVNVSNSTVSAALITNAGAITMDKDSLITAAGISFTDDDAKVEVDATGFSGMKKVIDLNSDSMARISLVVAVEAGEARTITVEVDDIGEYDVDVAEGAATASVTITSADLVSGTTYELTVTDGEEEEYYECTAAGAADSKIMLKSGAPGGVTLYYHAAEHDYWLTDASHSIIYLNGTSDWDSKQYGEYIGTYETTKEYFGYNATNSVEAATAAADADGSMIEVTGGVFNSSNAPAFNGVATIIKGGSFKTSMCGGSLITGASGTLDKTDQETISLTIDGGDFEKIVFGGDRVNGTKYVTRYADIEMTILSGTFHNSIAGGMALTNSNSTAYAKLIGNVDLTISGGNFLDTYDTVNEKWKNLDWIYGGCIASTKSVADNTTIDGNVTVTLDARYNDVTVANLVAGSYGDGDITGYAKLVLKGGCDVTANGEIWGGCSGDSYGGYIEDSGNRTLTKNLVAGKRILSFTGFTGTLTSEKIRAFSDVEILNGSKATVANTGNLTLSDVINWTFGAPTGEWDEDDCMLTGDFTNNFWGDTLNLKGFDTAGTTFTLMSGSSLKSGSLKFDLLKDIQMDGHSVGITPGGCVIGENTLTWSWDSDSDETGSWLGGELVVDKADGTMKFTTIA